MKTLYLYLRDFSCEETEDEVLYSGRVGWLIQAEEDTDTTEGECHVLDLKSDLAEYDDGTRFNATVLFLDDSYTLFVRETVPGKSVPQIRRALPFAVENYLSDDLENTHIAHGPISRGSAIDCVAISSEIFGNILAALKLSGIYPTTCTTFGMQIPQPEEEHDVSVVLDDNCAWLRTSEHLALVSIETLADAMTTISGHRDPVPTIRIWNFEDSDLDFFDQSMYEQEIFDSRDQSLVVFAVEQYSPNNCVNLLQGKYSAKENAEVNVRRWVMTGVFGIVCLYAYIALQASEGVWAMFQGNSVEKKMRATFVEIYEEEPRSRNIARQMRDRLGYSGDTTREFDSLIERLADVLTSPVHSATIDSIGYSATRQELDVAYRVLNYEAMETFIESLRNNSLSVEPGTAETHESSVRANLKLTLP